MWPDAVHSRHSRGLSQPNGSVAPQAILSPNVIINSSSGEILQDALWWLVLD